MAHSEAQDLWALRGEKARAGGVRMRNLESSGLTGSITTNTASSLRFISGEQRVGLGNHHLLFGVDGAVSLGKTRVDSTLRK